MAVRNSSVARGTMSGSGLVQIYVVPAATVLLLKSIYVRNEAAGSTTYELGVRKVPAPPNVALMGSAVSGNLASLATVGWNGWIALNATDAVYLIASAGVTLDYWLSGALLT